MAKSTNTSNPLIDLCQTDDSKWDIAINEAEGEIGRLKTQLNRIQMALQVFRQHKKDGVRWPNSKGLEKSTADFS